MAATSGTISITGTGTINIVSLPFQPSLMLATVSSEDGVSENAHARLSTGVASDDFQGGDSILVNTHGEFSREYYANDRVLNVLATPASVLTTVLQVIFTQFTSDGVDLNVTVKHASYNFRVRLEFFE